MHGMGSPGLFDYRADAEPWNDGPVGISAYHIRIDDFFCRNNHLTAGVNAFKINPHAAPPLSIAFSIRPLAVNDADVGNDRFYGAQIGAAKRVPGDSYVGIVFEE